MLQMLDVLEKNKILADCGDTSLQSEHTGG